MNASVLWDIVSLLRADCILHFNFLVLTLKSRCYFVYDIFAIVRNAFEVQCFRVRFIAVGV